MSDEQPVTDPPAEGQPPAEASPPAEGTPAEGQTATGEGAAAAEGKAEDGKDEAEDGEDKPEGEDDDDEDEDDEDKEEGEGGIGERIKKDPLELAFLEPLPEKVAFDHIPQVNDSRSVWRLGMRKLEETFAEHIANMHLDFEGKAAEFEKIQKKLEINHAFLEQHYIKMQQLLNEKYASIKIERDAWELEKEEIRKLVNLDSEVVNLNIGGTMHLQTERKVLQHVENSTLAKYFSGMHELKELNGEIFLDRDGKTFETLVNYLRNERKVFPEFTDKNSENHFYKELHHWGIDQHNREWMERYLNKLDRTQLNLEAQAQALSSLESPQSLQPDQEQQYAKPYEQEKYPQQQQQPQPELPSYLQQSQSPSVANHDYDEEDEEDDTPGVALKAVKEKWAELGPLKLEDIIANSTEPIDQSLQFGQSQFNKFIIGQIGQDGRVQGVGKEINQIIYEGQFKNDIYHGYGRYIYSNGNYYIGNWVDGKRSGFGKLVDKQGKTYEGMWQYSKFIGN